jgi:DNA repair protein RadA/Sms
MDEEDTVLLSDSRLSKKVERLKTGFLDPIFGGVPPSNYGLARTSVNLVAGPPGAGKTTLFLMLADALIETVDNMVELASPQGKEVLYIANEQEPAEILDVADRIQIKNLHRIRIVKAMGGLKQDLGELMLSYKPCLIILDSLTNLAGDNLELAVTYAKRLKPYTVELKAPSLIVNQIVKSGDHAGLMQLQHAVDATFMLDKDDPDDGSRFFYSMKNRFGMVKGMELEMTPETAKIPGKLIPKESLDDDNDL